MGLESKVTDLLTQHGFESILDHLYRVAEDEKRNTKGADKKTWEKLCSQLEDAMKTAEKADNIYLDTDEEEDDDADEDDGEDEEEEDEEEEDEEEPEEE